MKKIIVEKLKVDEEIISYIERNYEDYSAKKDLLSMIFDIHKLDEDDSIIVSKPFKTYEKEFAKSKIIFDETLKNIQENIIPDRFKEDKYKFEVNFIDRTIDIYIME